MSFRIEFDIVSGRIIQQTDISALSGADKVQLFEALLKHLGIADRFASEPEATERAQKIMTEQFDAHWGAA